MAGTTFTNPEQINILERWNSDGSYGYEESTTAGKPLSTATWFRLYENAMHGGNGSPVTARITFDQAMPLDHLLLQWRPQWDHAPTTWEIYDQNGLIASDSASSSGDFLRTYQVPSLDGVNPRPASQYLELVTSTSSSGVLDLARFAAYLAPGTPLAIDGTFNVFYEEASKMTVTSGYYDTAVNAERGGWLAENVGNLYSFATTEFNCGCYWDDRWESSAGWVEWELSQPYTFSGVFLTKYSASSHAWINGLTFKVFDEDAEEWVTVFGPQGINDSGYLAFSNEVTGSKIEMSWAGMPGGGGHEILQLQLFGAAIPEPATMSLLVLGGLALLRRRAA